MLENNNGLTLHKIKLLKPISVNNIIEIQTYIKTDSLVVAYLDYTVLVGRYRNNGFEFYNGNNLDSKYVQKIRVFNKDEEFLLWRSGNGFKGRYRKDEDGDEIDVVDARQVLFGTESKPTCTSGNYTEIFEKRGTKLILPFSNLKVDEKRNRIFLKTRNYIDDNACQATYIDCRFLGFSKWNEKLSKMEDLTSA